MNKRRSSRSSTESGQVKGVEFVDGVVEAVQEVPRSSQRRRVVVPGSLEVIAVREVDDEAQQGVRPWRQRAAADDADHQGNLLGTGLTPGSRPGASRLEPLMCYAKPRVERIPQPVAREDESEHEQHHGERREQPQVVIRADKAATDRDHVPHFGTSALTQTPRNDNDASATTATPTLNVAKTSTGGSDEFREDMPTFTPVGQPKPAPMLAPPSRSRTRARTGSTKKALQPSDRRPGKMASDSTNRRIPAENENDDDRADEQWKVRKNTDGNPLIEDRYGRRTTQPNALGVTP